MKWNNSDILKRGIGMTFDANGKPTGRCEAPVVFSCYANDYLVCFSDSLGSKEKKDSGYEELGSF